MKNLRQRGELALTLSLLGIFISLVGIGIGTGMSRSVQQSTSQAEADPFPFKSVLEVQEILPSGQIQTLQWENGFTWKNSYVDVVTEKIITGTGQIKDNNGLARIVWDPISTGQVVPAGIRGAKVDVELFIPDSYEVKSSFCTPADSSICKKVSYSGNSLTIRGITIEKGGDITYGIKVAKKGGQQPTATPTSNPTATPTQVPTATQTPNACPISGAECVPRNVKVTKVAERSIDIEWDLPQGCVGFKQGSDYWIDVERPGDSIVCAAEGGSDGNKQCVLGKSEITQDRLLNKDSEEFKKRKWDENREYTVKVFTHNASPSCVSPVASTIFTYELEAEPTEAPKKEGLSCGRGCIYSEGTKCLVGRCRADNPDCTDGIANANIGCEYAGDANSCGIPASEVDCDSGELKEKKDNRTACEAQNGSCYPEANCAAEPGGVIRKDLAGCTGRTVCCVLPPKQETFKLSYNLDMKDALLNGSGNSLFRISSFNSVTNGWDHFRSKSNAMSGIVNIPVNLHNNSAGVWFSNITNLSNMFLTDHDSDITIKPIIINRVLYTKQGGFDDRSFISLLDLLQKGGGGYIAADYQSVIETLVVIRDEPNAKRSQLNTLRSLYNPASKNHTFILNNNYSKNLIVSVVDPSMDNYSVNNYSNHIVNVPDDQFRVEVQEDLLDLVKLDIPSGPHKFVLGNMRVGDGKYVFIYGVPSNYVAVSSNGCSDMRSLGLAWRCIFDVDDKDISIDIVRQPERKPGDTPSFASAYVNTSDTQYQTSSLTICGSDSCEDVPLSTFRSIEDYESRLGVITHISCSATADDGAIVNCDPVSLMSNGTHFIQIASDATGDKAQIVTQSQLADVDGDEFISSLDLAEVISGADLNGDGSSNALDMTLVLGKIGSEVERNLPYSGDESIVSN